MNWSFSFLSVRCRGYQYSLNFCCCSVTKSCLTVCNPWTAAHQASLSSTISQTLLKFMLIESGMRPNHLILCCPFSFFLQSFPLSGSFPMCRLFASGGQSIGASASASVLPMYIQDWFPLGWTGCISLQSKGLSKVFSNTSLKNISSLVPRLLYGPTLTSVCDHWKNHSFDQTDLCRQSDVSAFNVLSRFVIVFLPRSNKLFFSWWQSLSTVILEPKKIKSVTASSFPPSICHEVMVDDKD